MNKSWRLTLLAAPMVLGLFSASCSGIDQHAEMCRKSARVIVHDAELWREYLIEAEKSYTSRAERFPDTRRAVLEYAPNFDVKYGPDLSDMPNVPDGSIVREDIVIVKKGKPVAQFVDFFLGGNWPGYGAKDCTGLYPKLYSNFVLLDD